MLRSLYDHGADVPASGLSGRGLGAALRDPAGSLWVDLQAPSPGEEQALAQAMAAAAGRTVLEVWVPGGIDDPGAGLHLALGANFVITRRRREVGWLDELWSRAAGDAGVITGGGLALTATLTRSALSALAATLDEVAADLARLEALGPAAAVTGGETYDLRRRLTMVRAGLEPLAAVAEGLTASELPPLAAPPRGDFAAAGQAIEAAGRRAALLDDRAALLAQSGSMALVARVGSSFRAWSLVVAAAALLLAAAVAALAVVLLQRP